VILLKHKFSTTVFPITDQVAVVVQAVVEEVKQKSTSDNNPNKLLFVRFDARRKGRCPEGFLSLYWYDQAFFLGVGPQVIQLQLMRQPCCKATTSISDNCSFGY